MNVSKRITGLKPSMPLRDAAERVLSFRFGAVETALPLAAKKAHKDIEHVHQLRVCTRRARAAIDVFADCLDAKSYRRLRKQFRRIRRAAGAARDADVFLESVSDRSKQAVAREKAGLHWLSGRITADRQIAQQELENLFRDRREQVHEAFETALSGLGTAASSQTFDAVAGPVLIGLLHDMEKAAAEDLADYEKLHRVRIEGKRLRYALEIFCDCFPEESYAPLYAVVEEMQEILGDINDSYSMVQRLNEAREQARQFWPAGWKLWQAGVDAFRQFHQRRFTGERRRFGQFRRRWEKQKRGEQLAAMVSALAAHPGGVGGGAPNEGGAAGSTAGP